MVNVCLITKEHLFVPEDVDVVLTAINNLLHSALGNFWRSSRASATCSLTGVGTAWAVACEGNINSAIFSTIGLRETFLRDLPHTFHKLIQDLRYQYLHNLSTGDLFLVDGRSKLFQEST